MTERVKKLFVLISTVAVIFVSYLVTIGYISGATPATISDKYPTIITPANYAFSIWGIIYFCLVIFSIYQLHPPTSKSFGKVRSFYILMCLANIGWIYSWHFDLVPLSLVAMLIILSSLVLINFDQRRKDSLSTFWFVKIPFSIYFGWISVAAVLNIFILLSSLGINGTGRLFTIITCISIMLLLTAAVFIRQKISTFAYPLVIAWALTAIAVKQSGRTAVVVVCALGVIAMLVSSLSFFLKDNSKFK